MIAFTAPSTPATGTMRRVGFLLTLALAHRS